MDSRWHFAADMNNSGTMTISDVWLWIEWYFYYPGDYFIRFISETETGQFFEYSLADYGGFTSFIVSGFLWVSILWVVFGSIIAIRNNSSWD